MSTILIEYDEEIVVEDRDAKLFVIQGEEMWVPESLIDHQDEDDQTIEIPRWKAKDLGLIED